MKHKEGGGEIVVVGGGGGEREGGGGRKRAVKACTKNSNVILTMFRLIFAGRENVAPEKNTALRY